MDFVNRTNHRRVGERVRFGATPELLPGAPPRLNVLLLEDSAADAGLIIHELRRGGYDPRARRVGRCGEMLEALGDGGWQIVLLDYTVEGGETALEALAALAELDVDLPAILISGVIGEEEAADALRAGARDFVNKGNLTRLVPAIARELALVEGRRQQAEGERALELSEQRLRLALDAGGMASWEWDFASDRLHWSEKLEWLFGLETGAFGGSYAEMIELVHPDDRELVGASLEHGIGHDSPALVYRALWRDGTVHWHERKSIRVRDEDGKSVGMAGVTFDVTEREEAARALRESEERFRLIAEHAQDLIALLDVDGRYQYLSPSCESFLGYPAEKLIGTLASELIHPDDWLQGWEWGADGLHELRMRTAEGAWLWVESLSYAIAGSAGPQFAVITRDVSERKTAETGRLFLEDELRQSHKMEAVGQLAGGIAHDFNNLLTVISGYTELLLRKLGREAEGTMEIAEVGKAAKRAARLTHQLLAYSRKQVIRPEVLDLSDLVAETETMLERVIRDDIELATALAETPACIRADRGQVEQIIMNLVVNGRDAMPGGGKLVLETRTVAIADEAAPQDARPGDYVMLCVSDTGVGMAPATVARIFEPFYTTKERGAGTGLGLATVDGIVRQNGGQIEVESLLGVGTTFRVYFPAVAGTAQAFAPRPLDEQARMGSETVLLVEDDRALREVGRQMLEAYGYTVLLAGDGAEALELAAGHPGPIHLLMTDILMPKVGGIELAERLSNLRPDLKVLYTSGYNDSRGNLQWVAGARYVQKPYAMEELAITLRELLDSAQPAVAQLPAARV